MDTLTERIKTAPEEEKQKLAAEKRTLQTEAILIDRVLALENTKPEDYKKEKC